MKLMKNLFAAKNGSASRAIDDICRRCDTSTSINSLNPGAFTNSNNSFWQR